MAGEQGGASLADLRLPVVLMCRVILRRPTRHRSACDAVVGPGIAAVAMGATLLRRAHSVIDAMTPFEADGALSSVSA